MSFGTKLAKYRKQTGITQDRLAGLIGIHVHHLSDIENGKVSPPGTSTFARICEFLNLSPEEISDLLEAAKHQKSE